MPVCSMLCLGSNDIDNHSDEEAFQVGAQIMHCSADTTYVVDSAGVCGGVSAQGTAVGS